MVAREVSLPHRWHGSATGVWVRMGDFSSALTREGVTTACFDFRALRLNPAALQWRRGSNWSVRFSTVDSESNKFI